MTTIHAKKGKNDITVYGDVEIIDDKTNSQYYVKNHGQESHNEFLFAAGSGKDTIYDSNVNDSLHFSDVDLSGIRFTNSGKDNDLVVKKNNNKDTITLVNYFGSDSKLNNIETQEAESTISSNWIEISNKGEINGIQDKNYASYITGSSNADTINAGLGENQIQAGKGDDTIIFKNKKLNDVEEFNRVGMLKGDGNDTIKLNFDGGDVTEGMLEALPQLYFDTDVDFSYSKEKNDLIIKATHNEKGNKYETVRIEDYFDNNENNIKTLVKNGIELNKGFETVISTVNLSDEVETYPLTINGVNARTYFDDKTLPNDIYIYNGSVYDDVITGSTKVDEMFVYGGENIITTGKSGGTYISSTNEGDDYYTVTSLTSGTIISDDGGENTIQINGINKNDIHLYADVNESLAYVNSSNINAIKNINKDNVYSFTKTAKGVLDYNGTVEHVCVADSKGENIKNINYEEIENVAADLQGEVNHYVNYLKNNFGINVNSAIEILTASTKNLNSLQKKALTSVQSELTQLYKTSYLGTSDSNAYTLKKGNHYIGSGAGSDTYTFSGSFGYADATDRYNHETNIYTSLSEHETDTIKITKYAFSKDNLTADFDFDDNRLILNAYDTDKKGSYKNTISYYNDDIINRNDRNLVIKDKSGQYSVIATTNEYNSNWENNDKKINHLAFIKSTQDAFINSNTGYNQITLFKADGVDPEHRTAFSYHYNGGHDIINSTSEFSDDEYMINFTSNSDVRITDADGVDSLDISSTSGKFNVDSLRLILNVEYDTELEEYVTGSYSLVSTSNLKTSNLTFIDGEFVSKKGVTVNGDMETVRVANNVINMNKWTDYISEQVATFLNVNHYSSAAEVFENGSSQDVKQLVGIYNRAYSDIPDLAPALEVG